MNQKFLSIAWAGMFILCAALGFIPEPGGALRILMTGLSVLFFLPGVLLLTDAKKNRDTATLKLIRNLSGASLSLTAALIIANFLSILGSDALGDALYAVLIIVSSPMVCSGYWLLSLFLWACLLIVSLGALHKKKTGR